MLSGDLSNSVTTHPGCSWVVADWRTMATGQWARAKSADTVDPTRLPVARLTPSAPTQTIAAECDADSSAATGRP